ncbi:MAG TPA: response regulator [Planktothrix sp.]
MQQQSITALVFDPNEWLKGDLFVGQIPSITLRSAASADQLGDSLDKEHADVLLVDMQLPGMTGLSLVSKIRILKPNIPVILLSVKAPTEQDWISLASHRQIQVIQAPITRGKLMYHLSRLFDNNPDSVDRKDHKVSSAPVEQLRNEKGRLDADLIANLFDLNMTEVALNVGVSRQALSKTSDSISIQSPLFDFERIARGLIAVTGSTKGLKMWLHTPNDRFDSHTPLDVIKLGKVKLLADWIDDARLGSPD